MIKLCDYGCGKEATHQFKNGKLCCSNIISQCTEIRRKSSLKKFGKIPWNKGKRNIFSKESLIRLSNILKKKYGGEKNPMYGKKHSTISKEKMSIRKKGKTYEEIMGIEISKIKKEKKRKEMLEWQSVYMNSFIKNPSKPQVELYNKVKEIYSTAILNYPFYPLNYSLDIAIPELKIWFESDGSWWHQDKEKDLERQIKIEDLGWKCIRYTANSIDDIPSKDKIIKDINEVIKND